MLIKFSGFDILQGGTGNNTFEVNTTFDGTLNGGGVSTSSPGTAIFDLNTDGSVTGGINGQSGDSTISYSGAVDVIVSGIDSADPPSATAETRRQAFLAGSLASTRSLRLEARSLVIISPAPGPSTRPTLTRT